MPPQDWNRIKQVFSAALSVPPGERDAYLNSACEGSDEVRPAVDELLRAHYDASQTFLEPGSIVLATPWLFREGDRVANRFKVIRRIARGAMGEVYQVYDERLRLQVALKAIRPELIGDADTVERFRREVLVTREIAHDGLCRVFDLVEHAIGPQAGFPDGTIVPCLTMQLLEGQTLEEWLTRHRPMSTAEALPFLRQIADALEVLHDAGVVHRDLKPSNVMLVETPEGMRAVLTDFGLARPLDESVFETQVRVQGGAPFYMAPELFRGERPSRASDIYAFGLIVDEMVTKERAFSADSLHALLLQKLGDGPAAPSARSQSMPRAWEQTILRCLAPDPRDRFSRAGAVLEGLSSGPRRFDVERLRRSLRGVNPFHRTRGAAYAAAATVIVLTGVAVGYPLELGPTRSVVVRPFANLTQNPELEYLARGTAGELARRLSRVRGLRVYSSDSTASANPSRAATYAMQGQFQALNEQLRITVELTDAAAGALLWSQRFDGKVDEALQLQDQLAAEAVGALVQRQPSGPQGVVQRAIGVFARWLPGPRVPSTGTTNNAAYDAYLRGRTLFEDRTVPSALQAIKYLQRAVQEDPNFAQAYATLADVQGVLMDLHYAPHATLIREAERYANQALALDPGHPDVQLTVGAVRQLQWRWDEADRAYKRAIELHPTSARAHRWYAGLLLQFGRFEEAIEEHRYALDLDPSDFASQSTFAHTLFHAGRVKEAEAHLETLLSQRDLHYAHIHLGQLYAYLSGVDADRREEYFDKALQESEAVRRADYASQRTAEDARHSDYGDLIAGMAWSYQGQPRAAEPFLERLNARRAAGLLSSGMIARIYAAQQNAAKAIEALLEAEREHDRELYYINVSPHYAGIRREPQFRALVDRLGLSR